MGAEASEWLPLYIRILILFYYKLLPLIKKKKYLLVFYTASFERQKRKREVENSDKACAKKMVSWYNQLIKVTRPSHTLGPNAHSTDFTTTHGYINYETTTCLQKIYLTTIQYLAIKVSFSHFKKIQVIIWKLFSIELNYNNLSELHYLLQLNSNTMVYWLINKMSMLLSFLMTFKFNEKSMRLNLIKECNVVHLKNCI